MPPATKKKRVAIYYRVSTSSQQEDLQVDELIEYAKFRKLRVVGEYIDKGISGATRRRPALDQMMEACNKGKIDIVLVWAFDRFGRSTKHLVESLELFQSLGIDFVSYQQQIDTSTAAGKLLFTVISAFAEFERNMLSERVIAGQQAAKRRGKHIGRFTDLDKQDQIRQLRKQGKSIRAIATNIPCSTATVQKALKDFHT
jgi:DNA invertase Pin-like site-specific DNA recombinase